jgi:hypothetical protein
MLQNDMAIISGILAVATMPNLPIYVVPLIPVAPVKIVLTMKKDTNLGINNGEM